MIDRTKDNLKTKLRETALDIVIKSEQKKMFPDYHYSDAIIDLEKLAQFGKEAFLTNENMDKSLQQRIFESTKLALENLEPGERINKKMFITMYVLNQNMRQLLETHAQYIGQEKPTKMRKLFL